MKSAGKVSLLRRMFPALLVLFALSPFITARLSPHRYEGGRSRDQMEQAQRNRSAMGRILGEARSSMSDIMFIKTERYLHSGVVYRLDLDYDALSSKGAVREKGSAAHDHDETGGHEIHKEGEHHVHDAHCGHEHAELPEGDEMVFHCEGQPTVIPRAAEDFRGFVGHLHRQVKPWIDPSQPHMHTDGTELIPWYRLMTLSDPHHVRGYMIGAWWLKRQKNDSQQREALRFLEEGIENNPHAFQLYLMKGQIHRERGENNKSRLSYARAADLAVKKRPPDGEIGPDWTDYNEEDALASVRLAVFSEREFGRVEKAIEMARRYLASIGRDAILERVLHEMEDSLKG